MIADLKPYPAMKPSGVPWLGEVPAHWEVRRLGTSVLGRFFKGNGGNKLDEVPDGVPCVRYGDLYTQYKYMIERTRSFVTQERASGYTPISYGDVLFAASGETIEEIGKSAVNLIQEEACCGGDVLVFRPNRKIVPRFMGYASDCPSAMWQKASMGRGFTVIHIYGAQLKNLSIALPSLSEQAAIVRYLDHADRRIRRYIRAKQKLITLLEEQKQALIHQAVTGRIDVRTGNPYPAYKDSGVEWLGRVPEHWDVRRAKVLFRLRTEKSGVAHGRELLSIYTHIGVRPRKDLEEKGNKATTTDDYWIVKKGDLIANKLLAWMGAIGVSHYDGVTSPAYDILMPIVDLVSDYYHHTFRARIYLQQFKKRSRGIMDMRLRLYYEQFGQIPVLVPPADEQRAIVKSYDRVMVDIDHNINRTRRQIDLLREYRTRLIADVVTGKVDIREVAARLPDEVEEPELLDETSTLADAGEEAADDLNAVPEEVEA